MIVASPVSKSSQLGVEASRLRLNRRKERRRQQRAKDTAATEGEESPVPRKAKRRR